MKKRIFYALRSLKVTLPISFVLLAILWVLAFMDFDNASKVINLPEWYAILTYVLFWSIPSVVIVWRLISYSESDDGAKIS